MDKVFNVLDIIYNETLQHGVRKVLPELYRKNTKIHTLCPLGVDDFIEYQGQFSCILIADVGDFDCVTECFRLNHMNNIVNMSINRVAAGGRIVITGMTNKHMIDILEDLEFKHTYISGTICYCYTKPVVTATEFKTVVAADIENISEYDTLASVQLHMSNMVIAPGGPGAIDYGDYDDYDDDAEMCDNYLDIMRIASEEYIDDAYNNGDDDPYNVEDELYGGRYND